jgi:hypothetical protein
VELHLQYPIRAHGVVLSKYQGKLYLLPWYIKKTDGKNNRDMKSIINIYNIKQVGG